MFALVERLFFSAILRTAYTRSATGVPQRRHTPRPLRGSIVATGYMLTIQGTLKNKQELHFLLVESRKGCTKGQGTKYKSLGKALKKKAV